LCNSYAHVPFRTSSSEIGVTQHYAEQNRDLARRVMAETG